MSPAELPSMQGPICPLPISQRDTVVIGHGSGGVLTHQLIRDLFQKHLNSPMLRAGNDAAAIELPALAPEGLRLVTSTDAHIVTPLSFPGGDIGRLAVCGTVNDVSMLGAEVKYLTATFILEEGLPLDELEAVVASMAAAAAEAKVEIVAADTKVTEKGQCDKLFISTTGIGFAPASRRIAGDQAAEGDLVLLSGPVGNHGVAVAEARGNLGIRTAIQSDVAPLNGMIAALLQAAPGTHVLRDPTRGGLATTLVEIARQSGVDIALEEESIPVDPPVRKACELLGLDPLYMANEGKLIAIVPAHEEQAALSALNAHPLGKQAAVIGRVLGKSAGRLWLRTSLGTTRVLDMLAGAMLPRIC